MDRLDMMKAFVEVARQGGFAPAARQLDISTSALSRHVAALEDWLGVQLIHRSTRQVHLTDAGQGYLGRCLKVLDEIREIEKAGQETQGELTGKIHLSAPVFLGRRRIAPVLAKFLRAHPHVSVDLFLSDRHVDLVAEGFDLAIRVTKPEDSSLIARRLGTVRVCVVGAPDYRDRRGFPESVEGLMDHDCIVDRVPEGGDRWIFATQDGRVAQRVASRFRVNDGETARDMAIAGLGLARLPVFFIEEALISGALVEVDLHEDAEDAGLFALYPPSRHLSRNVRALIDLLVKELNR